MAGELGPMPLSVRQRARRSRSLARRWRWRLAHSFERLRVPFLRDGIDSVSSRCICALVTMSRVRKCIRSTRSKRAHRARVPKRRAAVRCHALNDLSRVVTLPGVQQAIPGNELWQEVTSSRDQTLDPCRVCSRALRRGVWSRSKSSKIRRIYILRRVVLENGQELLNQTQ